MRITKYRLEQTDDFRPALMKEYSLNYKDAGVLDNPTAIYEMMKGVFHLTDAAEEYVYMIAYNTALRCLGIFEISHGTSNLAFFYERSIFCRALLVNATGMIIVHNHPSGNLTPSDEDNAVTHRLREGGELVGINLIDHIIIAKDGYYSYAQEDRLSEV